MQKLKNQYQSNPPMEESTQRQMQHNQFNLPPSMKRISLPENYNYIPSSSPTNTNEQPESLTKPPLQQLMQHRLLQQKRQILQKQGGFGNQSSGGSQGGMVDALSPPLLNLSRRQMLRQASYKIAQQQQIVPPLPLSESDNEDLMSLHSIIETPVNNKDNNCPGVPSRDNNWANLPNSMQTACQISDLSGSPSSLMWHQPVYNQSSPAWNQVHY